MISPLNWSGGMWVLLLELESGEWDMQRRDGGGGQGKVVGKRQEARRLYVAGEALVRITASEIRTPDLNLVVIANWRRIPRRRVPERPPPNSDGARGFPRQPCHNLWHPRHESPSHRLDFAQPSRPHQITCPRSPGTIPSDTALYYARSEARCTPQISPRNSPSATLATQHLE